MEDQRDANSDDQHAQWTDNDASIMGKGQRWSDPIVAAVGKCTERFHTLPDSNKCHPKYDQRSCSTG